MKRLAFAALLGSLTLLGGCLSQHSVHVEPIQLQPIQVTMDVNVHVQEDSAGDEADDAADAADAATDEAATGEAADGGVTGAEPRPTE